MGLCRVEKCLRLVRNRPRGEVDECNRGQSSNRDGPFFSQIVEERVQECTMEHIVDVPVPQVVEETVEARFFPRNASQSLSSTNRRCASGGDVTPSTDHPDSSEDSGGSTSAAFDRVVDVLVVMK